MNDTSLSGKCKLLSKCVISSAVFTNKTVGRGAWVAQAVQHPTPGLSPDLDLMVVSPSPARRLLEKKQTNK